MKSKVQTRLKIAFAILLILGLVSFGGWLYWVYLISPPDPAGYTKAFVIQKGESVSQITNRLEEERLIRSGILFKITIKRNNSAEKIQAGDYKLASSMSLMEIIDTLTSRPNGRWVTLLEGLRIEEMAERLNTELGIKTEDFLEVAKEGYMFPDTYLFGITGNASSIAIKMQDNFNKKYDTALQKKILSKSLTTEEGVILASVIEREARSDKARREIAGILLKRLKIGMGLNADATIQYALGYQPQEKSWWKRHITPEDKQKDSRFNTYIYSGLPPAPICNPSLSSLNAVADADPDTVYLYYYHDSQGKSYYSKTLEEHNANIESHP